MSDDLKEVKVFVPPVPLTEDQLKPFKKNFEVWAGSLDNDKPPSKEQVEKLFIDGVQLGREIGFEEGYAKGGKIAAEHFTAVRTRRVYRDGQEPNTEEKRQINASGHANKELVSVELNSVMAAHAGLPDKVKLEALFDLLESKFGVKIDRSGESR